MITRPLELASRLRPRPRNFDAMFMVNVALIALFFVLFGSRFVLSPGRAIGSTLTLPVGDNPVAGAVATTVVISIKANGAEGQIFNDEGLVTFERLREWLKEHGKRDPGAALLVRADASISWEVLARVSDAATEAGLRVQLAYEEAKKLQAP